MAKRKPATTPVFAAVVQPAYHWSEEAHPKQGGHTLLPTKDDDFKATIATPEGETPLARAVRLHELLHARFTPEINALARSDALKDVSDIAKQIAEDVRLAHVARARGLLDAADAYYPKDVWAKLTDGGGDELKTAAAYMSAYGQPLEGIVDSRSLRQFSKTSGARFSRRTRKALERWGRNTGKVLKRNGDAQECFAQLAQATQVVLREMATTRAGGEGITAEDPQAQLQQDGDGEGAVSSQESSKEASQAKPTKSGRPSATAMRQYMERKAAEMLKGLGKESALQEVARKTPAAPKPTTQPSQEDTSAEEPSEERNAKQTAREERAMRSGIGGGAGRSSWTPNLPPPDIKTAQNYSLDATAAWGTMKTQIAPLERNFKALTYRMGASAPEGHLPKFMARWYADKQLFERKGRRRGGTLLVDISGSMSWAWEITKELIEKTPAMTVALYSGYQHGRGTLTIIAKDGKLTSQDFRPDLWGHGDHNEVDGPALAWLARQPRPRVWFSDGMVCACDRQFPNYNQFADVARICRLAAIKRTMDPNVVIKIFTGRPPAKPIENIAEEREKEALGYLPIEMRSLMVY